MKLNVMNLRKEPGLEESFQFVLDKVEAIDRINFTKPINVTGKVINSGNEFVLMGHITTEAKTECSRCLDMVTLSLDFDFKETYEYDADSDVIQDGLLDLDQVIRENLYINIPMRVVCSEDCPGLCPVCGRNLKEGQCSCENENIDPRLAVLKRLQTVKTKGGGV